MEFVKVNKTKARRLFNEGKTLYFVPCKVYPNYNNPWVRPYDINLERIKDEVVFNNFDSIVNNFEYYNCNSELGNYTHFYIEKEEEK
jgi:hypothetical protein